MLTYVIFGQFADLQSQRQVHRAIRMLPDHCIQGDLMFVRFNDTADDLVKKLTDNLPRANKLFVVRFTEWQSVNHPKLQRWLEKGKDERSAGDSRSQAPT